MPAPARGRAGRITPPDRRRARHRLSSPQGPPESRRSRRRRPLGSVRTAPRGRRSPADQRLHHEAVDPALGVGSNLRRQLFADPIVIDLDPLGRAAAANEAGRTEHRDECASRARHRMPRRRAPAPSAVRRWPASRGIAALLEATPARARRASRRTSLDFDRVRFVDEIARPAVAAENGLPPASRAISSISSSLTGAVHVNRRREERSSPHRPSSARAGERRAAFEPGAFEQRLQKRLGRDFFRAKACDRQDRWRLRRPQQLLEQHRAVGIRPVQIVDVEDERLVEPPCGSAARAAP